MGKRNKIILYNPNTVFYDMPLALLAIGSMIEKPFEVIIIDARIEENADQLILQHLPEAICFGTTIITGAPIKDGLRVSEMVKKHAPEVPVIWGGWHTSLFPTDPLRDHDFIDITVQGQGEETFKELVTCLSRENSLSEVKGIAYRKNGEPVKTPARPLKKMGEFPRLDYDLIDVEKYFAKKGRRQFDIISSTGCYFRCSFCADPFVFERNFTAIPADQLVEDLVYYHGKYQFDDINFQDETFFTYAKRIKAFAQGLVDHQLNVTWAATMRADQGQRLPDDVWKLCKESGLRRLLIGVESGSQEMMDWMKKDIKLPQVHYCSDKCKELGIGVIFPFIVGFPGESDQSIKESVQMIKKLRNQSEHFETPIFYFKPYPGTAITQNVAKEGFELPSTTEEWGDFDYIGSSGPWVSKEKEAFFEKFKFYLKLGYGKKKGLLYSPLKSLGRWRCKSEFFKFPIEKLLIERIIGRQKLS